MSASNVVPIRKCARCQKRYGRVMTLMYREGTPEEAIIPFISCDSCMRDACKELAEQRIIFEQLLTMGVPRDTANAMMIAKNAFEDERKKKG